MSEINIEDKTYYSSTLNNDRTRKRLIEMKEIGMTRCGYGEFGLDGKMSGLYIEKVWNLNIREWEDYMGWVKSFKNLVYKPRSIGATGAKMSQAEKELKKQILNQKYPKTWDEVFKTKS